MMTREGAKGMEWNAWSKGNAPAHTTILPFTRGLAGPIDYTPGIFDLTYKKYSDRSYWNNPEAMDTARVHTTLAKQLALYVVLYSPMQMAADMIENYFDNPAFDFISNVPTSFDETSVIDAEIGQYVITARRSGEDWFLGGITNESARAIALELEFLDPTKNTQQRFIPTQKKPSWIPILKK